MGQRFNDDEPGESKNNLPVNDDWLWSDCWYPGLHLQTKCPGKLTHSLLSEQRAFRLGISHSLISWMVRVHWEEFGLALGSNGTDRISSFAERSMLRPREDDNLECKTSGVDNSREEDEQGRIILPGR